MSIDKITSKILDAAANEKEKTLKEAEKRRDEILKEAKAKAKAIKKEMEDKGKEEKGQIIERRKSVAFIDSRKVLLNKKQEIIADCYDKAIDAIIAMDKAKYVELLVELGKASGIESGVLVFNKKEAKEIGKEIASALGKFTVSDECGDMRGGYIIQSGQVYVDNTIESLVKENESKLSSKVAEMLFPL